MSIYRPTTYGDINAGRAYYNGGSGGQSEYKPTQGREIYDENQRLQAEAEAKRKAEQGAMAGMMSPPISGGAAPMGMGGDGLAMWQKSNLPNFANGGFVRKPGPPMGMGGDALYASTHPQLPPGQFYDPQNGSVVIGIPNNPASKTAYLSGTKVAGNTWSGPAIGKDGQVYQGTGGTFGMGAKDKPDYAKYGPWGFAEGGEVDGPGGPKDDMIPAMLSDGEYIMPAEAVQFYGLDKLNKMRTKAKEGLNEMKPKGPPMGVPHMAGGGSPWLETLGRETGQFARDFVTEGIPAAIEGLTEISTPVANAVQGPLQIYGKALAAPFVGPVASTVDFGKGLYGGLAPQEQVMPVAAKTPAPVQQQPAPVSQMPAPAPEQINQPAAPMVTIPSSVLQPILPFGMQAAAPQQAAQPMVDPWSTAPMTGFDGRPMGGTAPAPMPTIEDMRFRGLAAKAQLDNQRAAQAKPFLAPWEKRDIERAQNMPRQFEGMNRTQSRRFAASPQGQAVIANERNAAMAGNVALTREQMQMQREAMRQAGMTERDIANFDQAMKLRGMDIESREKLAKEGAANKAEAAKNWTPVADTDYLINDLGSLVSKKTGKSVGLTKEEMEKSGLIITGADSEGKVTYGLPKAPDLIKSSPRVDPKIGIQFNVMEDGTRVPARIPNPTDTDKFNYFKYFEGKPDLKMSDMTDEMWNKAWHYAAGTTPGAPATTQASSYNTVEEATAANLPKGTIVIINGRRARID